MSHHRAIVIDGIRMGHLVITNDGQVLSIVIVQPWGQAEVFSSAYPEINVDEELGEDSE